MPQNQVAVLLPGRIVPADTGRYAQPLNAVTHGAARVLRRLMVQNVEQACVRG
jgi:hypothetical protein